MEDFRVLGHFIVSDALQHVPIGFDVVDGFEFDFTVQEVEFRLDPLQKARGEFGVLVGEFGLKMNLERRG